MYWNIDKTLSHNCLFNFCIGSRGVGKTYGCKKKAVKRFLKSGSEFMYIRRYKSEFSDIGTFWSDIQKNNEFPEHKLTSSGSKFFCDDKLFGYSIPLSIAAVKKSTAYPLVDFMIFDEFIIEKGTHRYLSNEVKAFLELYLTVSRYRPVIVMFIANSITMMNPYFLHFNLALPHGSTFFKKDDCLLEVIENRKFSDHVRNTRVGKLITATDEQYSDYAMDNQFLLDNRNFVMKRTAAAKHHFNLFYQGAYYGVWVDWSDGLMFVSDAYDPLNQVTYAITTSDHQANTMLIRSLKHSSGFSMLIDNFKLGNVRFDSIRVKAMFYEIVKLVIRV
jgi:hypothetical protein